MLLAGQEGNGKETTSSGRSPTCDGTLKTARHSPPQSQKQSNNYKINKSKEKNGDGSSQESNNSNKEKENIQNPVVASLQQRATQNGPASTSLQQQSDGPFFD
jgi:hypothetical protein